MKKLFFLCLFSLQLVNSAQNLLPNPGFETYTACPVNLGQLNSVSPWFNPTNASPDYFNQCATVVSPDVPKNGFGYQFAHGGNGYVGLVQYYKTFNNYREYMEVALTQTLSPGACYYVELFFSSADGFALVSPDLQVYLSDTLISAITHTNVLSYTPQIVNPVTNVPDTMNWFKMSGTYIAHGGEEYLLIGNFKNDTTTTIINKYPNSVSKNPAYVYIDDVKLILSTCTSLTEGTAGNRAAIFPQPFKNELNIKMDLKADYEIIIYDGFSRLMSRQKFDTEITLPMDKYPAGIYYYRLFSNGVLTNQGKLVKD